MISLAAGSTTTSDFHPCRAGRTCSTTLAGGLSLAAAVAALHNGGVLELPPGFAHRLQLTAPSR